MEFSIVLFGFILFLIINSGKGFEGGRKPFPFKRKKKNYTEVLDTRIGQYKKIKEVPVKYRSLFR